MTSYMDLFIRRTAELSPARIAGREVFGNHELSLVFISA